MAMANEERTSLLPIELSVGEKREERSERAVIDGSIGGGQFILCRPLSLSSSATKSPNDHQSCHCCSALNGPLNGHQPTAKATAKGD